MARNPSSTEGRKKLSNQNNMSAMNALFKESYSDIFERWFSKFRAHDGTLTYGHNFLNPLIFTNGKYIEEKIVTILEYK